MRRTTFIASATVLLSACSNPKDANEKNFAAATEMYLQKRGTLCLDLRQRWPVENILAEGSSSTTNSAAERLTALEAAGLVRSERVERAQPGGRPSTIVRYDLTDMGRQYTRPTERIVFTVSAEEEKKPALDLCYGQKTLASITKWEGPMKFGDYQEAGIYYTYVIKDVAPWADDEAMQRMFTSMKRELVEVPKEGQLSVKLTSAGWEAKMF
jgi:hypothetical protein